MKILVVDDEIKIADAMVERLRLRGFEATPAYDGNTALERLRTGAFDGMILDLRLPDIEGIAVLQKTRKKTPDLKVIILSGHGNEHDFKICLEMGACACFHKPAKITEIVEALTCP
ncbi:MAG: response regulator [Deltaproteobacteria bacterium]|nr:response regulator [Deltaproteobacteria bacterium]